MRALRVAWSYGLALLRDRRTYRFVTVGVATLVLAEAMMFGMVDLLGAESFLSAALVTEVTLVANFLINDRWTFGAGGDPNNGFAARLLKFHASRVGSIAVNLATFYLLNKVLLVNHLVAYFLAVVVAFSVNLLTSFVWVWKVRPGDYKGAEGPEKGFSAGPEGPRSSRTYAERAHPLQSSHSSRRCQNHLSSSSTST
ncbi:MAG: GtrA family protein [Thaumarchaeota archaeon]|nr:GtrA family protein [Candidatus Calditenuaceae archaeon]MCX8202796.1 GtrA family protein [Nitrososphaeria archaeon]MDW8043551.1 GtrA family protein [Nitrososphaerota archaeon]